MTFSNSNSIENRVLLSMYATCLNGYIVNWYHYKKLYNILTKRRICLAFSVFKYLISTNIMCKYHRYWTISFWDIMFQHNVPMCHNVPRWQPDIRTPSNFPNNFPRGMKLVSRYRFWGSRNSNITIKMLYLG